MNFDTKYLIRWGIPGWIMVMVLLPYFIVIYFDFLSSHVSTASDLLAIGAVLTVLGVPLGYLLNQIHHSLFWVLPKCWKGTWSTYFDEEIKVDEYFDKDESHKDKRERYRYLLSRKHELGGVVVSLGISGFVILLRCIYLLIFKNLHLWEIFYFAIVLTLFLILWLSRNYSSENIEKYHDYYLKQSHSRGILFIEKEDG
ncbi:hypothetical protein [Bacillus sp. J33]|uniref:hypothetical protein n=1 Tax=Bacillus sp. J33 TaxID=935836 RepID=UPI00047A5FE9|nr:hypothetical protein [Bacillus sp. J33]